MQALASRFVGPWLVAALLCGCDEPPAEKDGAAALAQKRASCEKLLDEGTQRFSRSLVEQLERAARDQDAELIACLKANPSDPARCMRPAEAEVYEKTRRARLADCVNLSDEMLDCLTRGDRRSERCAMAYARHEGLVYNKPQGPAPEPAWRLSLPGAIRGALGLSDGGLLLGLDNGAAMVRQGQLIWHRELDGGCRDMLAELDAGRLLVIDGRDRLQGLDAVSGQPAWTHTPPHAPLAIAFHHPHLRLLLADGVWYGLDAPHCEQNAPDCLRAGRRQPGEIARPVRALGLADGGRAVQSGKALSHLDPDGKPLFRIEARRELGGFDIGPGGELAVSADGWLFDLRLKRCRSDIPIYLVAMVDERGKVDFDLEHAPPPACIRWKSRLFGPPGSAPLSAGKFGIGVHLLDRLQLHHDGKQRWTTELGAIDALAASDDGRIFALCREEAEAEHLVLRAVSASAGATLWRRELDLPVGTAALLRIQAGLLLAGAGKALAAFDLRPRDDPNGP